MDLDPEQSLRKGRVRWIQDGDKQSQKIAAIHDQNARRVCAHERCAPQRIRHHFEIRNQDMNTKEKDCGSTQINSSVQPIRRIDKQERREFIARALNSYRQKHAGVRHAATT